MISFHKNVPVFTRANHGSLSRNEWVEKTIPTRDRVSCEGCGRIIDRRWRKFRENSTKCILCEVKENERN